MQGKIVKIMFTQNYLCFLQKKHTKFFIFVVFYLLLLIKHIWIKFESIERLDLYIVNDNIIQKIYKTEDLLIIGRLYILYHIF